MGRVMGLCVSLGGECVSYEVFMCVGGVAWTVAWIVCSLCMGWAGVGTMFLG